jgi:hypothetical protein
VTLARAQRDHRHRNGRRLCSPGAVVANRNSPQKHVWRARIILLTADGLGTSAIMRGIGHAASRWCGAGKSGLCRRAWTGCCAKDPDFVPKLREIVGFYVNPPRHAIVRSVDEKVANPGARPHPTRRADQEGACRHDDPRLQAASDDDACRLRPSSVCFSRHTYWVGG